MPYVSNISSIMHSDTRFLCKSLQIALYAARCARSSQHAGLGDSQHVGDCVVCYRTYVDAYA